MMAMLWAQQIILGKKTYGQVPRLLKDKVKEILEDSGMAELVKEDEEKHENQSSKSGGSILSRLRQQREQWSI